MKEKTFAKSLIKILCKDFARGGGGACGGPMGSRGVG